MMIEATVVSHSTLGKLHLSTLSVNPVSTTIVDQMPETSSDVAGVGTTTTVSIGLLLAGDGWARDARMFEGIFQIMEGMEPPWITNNVLEAAVVRFPAVEREILRLTIMTMMMTQRRCVVRLTRAGLRLGPRIDREGSSFLELDLDYADRYSTSH